MLPSNLGFCNYGIESDYERACRAARAVAEEHLEATKVCRRFLEDIGL